MASFKPTQLPGERERTIGLAYKAGGQTGKKTGTFQVLSWRTRLVS